MVAFTDVIMKVNMEITVFWDEAPCSLVTINQFPAIDLVGSSEKLVFG